MENLPAGNIAAQGNQDTYTFQHELIKKLQKEIEHLRDTIKKASYFNLKVYNQLSNREKEIASYLLKGFSNAEIAESLFVCTKTIKYHLTNIYAKLDIKDRLRLVIFLKTKD